MTATFAFWGSSQFESWKYGLPGCVLRTITGALLYLAGAVYLEDGCALIIDGNASFANNSALVDGGKNGHEYIRACS